METTIVNWVNLGFRDNGKENADYYSKLGLGFRDNGKGHGNYYSGRFMF